MDTVALERLLADAFARVDPGIVVRVVEVGPRPGRFVARIQSASVEVAWLSRGWPREVRELLDRPDRPDLVVAPALSPGARGLLGDAGLSWVDGTGATRIALPGLYVRVEAERVARPAAKAGWTAGILAVCEGLLVGTGGTVDELVAATGLAPSTVGGALRFLQDEHLLEAAAARGRNARRTVVDVSELLDAYATTAAHLRGDASVRVGVLWRDPAQGARELGARLAANGLAWSTTGALAADVLAPHLSEVAPLEIYLDVKSLPELRQVAREASLSEAAGGRLLLRPFPTPARDALSTTVAGQRVATWPRVFSDLRMIGVRGEDAAEHLREQMGAVA
ncbi:hypothetical protein [Sporichthya sp.]|uniref:hypothetical protein n=1 Tax=Sporichthya sp. TaxID=65475 RepID=UPI001793B009|nr:hypothetical protein [Sporichthya sp.]MBA3743378.1 hypothetical protein [Sporichthya sp.]